MLKLQGGTIIQHKIRLFLDNRSNTINLLFIVDQKLILKKSGRAVQSARRKIAEALVNASPSR